MIHDLTKNISCLYFIIRLIQRIFLSVDRVHHAQIFTLYFHRSICHRNMPFAKVLNMNLLGRGATGTVYQLNAFIAVKRARRGDDEQADHAHEQEMLQILETKRPLPYLIRCYFQRPSDTFLELAPNGSVAMLLNQYLKRKTGNSKMSQALDSHDVCRWMRQLCLAATALERIGLVHGDIRPGNMLLDADWNLKLSDFDRGMKIGEDIVVLTEPYGRLLHTEAGGAAGTYGIAGARTETFAIGSVYYTLLRGHEPYETESWGKDHSVILVEKLQRKEFPLLTNSAEDAIIRKCWNGEYCTVRELLLKFPGGAEQGESISDDPKWLETRRMECENFIQSGLVDSLETY